MKSLKNIHVLPTDKPSRLWINNLLQGKLQLHKELLIGSNTAQQIYITSNNFSKISDEGVHHNSGDWLLDTINNKIFQASINIISEDDIQKIILTNDLDLIKDGVQAIDDEFLEWFVKNPSCEFVKVEECSLLNTSRTYLDIDKYKIIIPKEKPKQETLEEAMIKNGYHDKESDNLWREGVEFGAKWQQEKSYSEEDLKEAFRQGMDNMDYSDTYGWSSKLTEQEWFEQFKQQQNEVANLNEKA
jgi:hypothetical protein